MKTPNSQSNGYPALLIIKLGKTHEIYPEKEKASQCFLVCANADNWICALGFIIVPLPIYVAAPELIKRYGKAGSTPDGMRWLALGIAIFLVLKLIINLKARNLTLAGMLPAGFSLRRRGA